MFHHGNSIGLLLLQELAKINSWHACVFQQIWCNVPSWEFGAMFHHGNLVQCSIMGIWCNVPSWEFGANVHSDHQETFITASPLLSLPFFQATSSENWNFFSKSNRYWVIHFSKKLNLKCLNHELNHKCFIRKVKMFNLHAELMALWNAYSVICLNSIIGEPVKCKRKWRNSFQSCQNSDHWTDILLQWIVSWSRSICFFVNVFLCRGIKRSAFVEAIARTSSVFQILFISFVYQARYDVHPDNC